jgi:cytochrome c peroxidase
MRSNIRVVLAGGVLACLCIGQVSEPVVPLRSLKEVPVPEPPELDKFVRDRQMAVVLGKALFWDMQVGSDGVQACATCHFHAGADSRTKNQLSPAAGRLDASWRPLPDSVFTFGAPNYELNRADFPLRKLANPADRNSAVLSDSNMIVSSQGIHKLEFLGIVPYDSADRVRTLPDAVFHVNQVNVRQVPHRAAPSVINAVFNHRQFWDGRAQSEFNGVNPWGDRDPFARVVEAVTPVRLAFTRVRLTNASLASQAVEPGISRLEASSEGRTFPDIGSKLTPDKKKLRDLGRILRQMRPLAKQLVASDDSVLGRFSAFPLKGLRGPHADSYQTLIQNAFDDRWWRANNMLILVYEDGRTEFVKRKEGDDRLVPGDPFPRAYTLLEYNFSLFFGIAVQMYEATLVSDDTPFDRYMEGQADALTARQIEGMKVFNSNVGRCVNCHGGAEFTNASVTSAGSRPLFRRSGDLLDTGFNNIGLRPAREDPGLGATDPWGKALSVARLVRDGLRSPPVMNPPWGQPYDASISVDGAFKTPGLRNIELTAPYFRNGSQLTLRQVVDFYSRGGDFQPIERREPGAIAPLHTLGLTDQQKDDVVAFLLALTDERVRYEKAPFDHPEIFIPNGHVGDTTWVANNGQGLAEDQMMWIPTAGRGGRLVPRPGFLE